MASILFSFVGTQDPFGDEHGEGSIVSLLRELKSQGVEILKAILLYTEGGKGTYKNGLDTKEYLESDEDLKDIIIELLPVQKELSNDPTNLSIAIDNAKSELSKLRADLGHNDLVEFNASSGTPAMKATFSVFQAAQYFPNSRVWQVRDPKAQSPDQRRVFESDISSLRREFDLTVLLEFINEYNYSAALRIIKVSKITLNQDLLNKLVGCNFWNQGQFEEFYKMVKPYLKPQQKNQVERTYWWRAYEQAYTAVVRFEQKNFTEAMLHSYRAVEGLIAEWIKHDLKEYVVVQEGQYNLLKKSILQKHKIPKLEAEFRNSDLRNEGMIQIRSKVQSILINSIILKNQHNPDFKGWNNEGATNLRNLLSHSLGGISEKELFSAWCDYQYNSATGSYTSKNDITDDTLWKNRLLNCLNLIAGQQFTDFAKVSLLAYIHKDIQSALAKVAFDL